MSGVQGGGQLPQTPQDGSMDGGKHQVLPVRIVDRQCCDHGAATLIHSILENSSCRSGEDQTHIDPGKVAVLHLCILVVNSCTVALQGKIISHS